MNTSELYVVYSCHQCDDGDYDQAEFVTNDKEYAAQWVYAANRDARDPLAYHSDVLELRTVNQ